MKCYRLNHRIEKRKKEKHQKPYYKKVICNPQVNISIYPGIILTAIRPVFGLTPQNQIRKKTVDVNCLVFGLTSPDFQSPTSLKASVLKQGYKACVIV